MSASARNFVYDFKVRKDDKNVKPEPVITNEELQRCKKVADKYRVKKQMSFFVTQMSSSYYPSATHFSVNPKSVIKNPYYAF